MAQRLSGYQGYYPWWAWFHPKPDLRSGAAQIGFPPGTRAVRLELAMPAERVLLSNYQAWFCVLNRSCLSLEAAVEEEPLEFESWSAGELAAAKRDRELTEAERANDPVWPLSALCQVRMVPSWERIFDLETTEAGWGGDVQACFERLELADVVAVTEFTARDIGRWKPAAARA